MIRTQVLGIGSYVPDRVVPNDELRFLNDRHERQETQVTETNNEWIIQRTGIKERHIAAEGQFTSDLAVARRDFPRHPVSAYLNGLVARGHGAIYRDGGPRAARRWFDDTPLKIRRKARRGEPKSSPAR